MDLILERIGDSYECVRCIFSVSLLPDAIKHARDEHSCRHIKIIPKGLYEIPEPEEHSYETTL